MKSALPSQLVPFVCLLAALCLGFAVPASAQPDFHLGIRAGVADLSGNGLYRDVPDDTIQPVGVQGELRWPAFSLRLAYEQADVEGTFAPGFGRPALSPTYDIDGDLSFIHVTAAYNGETPGQSWSWFAGGGPSYADGELSGRARFSNTGPFDLEGNSTGLHAVGGVRWELAPRWEVGGELMYMHMLESFDLGGFATSSDTDDLDGFSGMATLSFGF